MVSDFVLFTRWMIKVTESVSGSGNCANVPGEYCQP